MNGNEETREVMGTKSHPSEVKAGEGGGRGKKMELSNDNCYVVA